MRYFRLIENLEGRSPLGFGLGAGRWNQFGTPIIYGCSVSSLNFLELLSIKGAVVTQSKWKLVVLEINELLPELDASLLPTDWKNRPHPRSTQEFGTAWAKGMISPVLKIPSCRIPISSYPSEHNILINPLHPDLPNSVKLVEEWDVSFEVNS
ncbi:RES family NAD+ phosphorylase [Algoriphagus antarcticus]|uniref:RES domain-containing protein n=1 Tax=Algoriphagus antarcticus TaxID=238540 RepID=A0A3E0DLI8_9BACT|nr:RES family NAD+ phosphorylase [Algoriphagus antarcticus]REG83516.1 RES domain-containing protein [Algoriphagus antarcticus]